MSSSEFHSLLDSGPRGYGNTLCFSVVWFLHPEPGGCWVSDMFGRRSQAGVFRVKNNPS